MLKTAITAALFAASLSVPALADPPIPRWKTNHSMGCMLLRECTNDTWRIHSVADLEKQIAHPNYGDIREEADGLLAELDKMGVEVYLADDRYFTRGVAGTYHAGENKFFLNNSWSDDPYQLLQTMRHEAWHAAQDAMAGTIDNTMLAVIEDDAKIPLEYKLLVEIAYPPNARPWEQEAKWAGSTPNMTLEVLQTINRTNGKPWTEIEPTPLTRLWLERNGYL